MPLTALWPASGASKPRCARRRFPRIFCHPATAIFIDILYFCAYLRSTQHPVCEGVALGLFPDASRIRQAAFGLVTSKHFEGVVGALILANCVVLALDGPSVADGSSFRRSMDGLELALTALFFAELTTKLIAFGAWSNGQLYVATALLCADFDLHSHACCAADHPSEWLLLVTLGIAPMPPGFCFVLHRFQFVFPQWLAHSGRGRNCVTGSWDHRLWTAAAARISGAAPLTSRCPPQECSGAAVFCCCLASVMCV